MKFLHKKQGFSTAKAREENFFKTLCELHLFAVNLFPRLAMLISVPLAFIRVHSRLKGLSREPPMNANTRECKVSSPAWPAQTTQRWGAENADTADSFYPACSIFRDHPCSSGVPSADVEE